jgi:hypothetical protein
MREHHLPAGDFPDPARFAEILGAFDLNVSHPPSQSAHVLSQFAAPRCPDKGYMMR